MTKSEAEKPILYLCGGTLSGIFSVGVLNAFEEAGINGDFTAIYGGSAGAMNAASFISGSLNIARDGYIKGMKGGLVRFDQFWSALWQRFNWDRVLRGAAKPINLIDIDYLFDYINSVAAFDYKKIAEHKIPFYAPLLDLDSGEIRYQDVREQPEASLKAAVALAPYYGEYVSLNDRRYVDGAIAAPLPINYLLEKHPGRRIIIVINKIWGNLFWRDLSAHLEAIVARMMYGDPLAHAYQDMVSTVEDAYRAAEAHPEVHIVAPPQGRKTPSTKKSDDAIYKQLYEDGVNEGRRLLDTGNLFDL